MAQTIPFHLIDQALGEDMDGTKLPYIPHSKRLWTLRHEARRTRSVKALLEYFLALRLAAIHQGYNDIGVFDDVIAHYAGVLME
jgi:hypothetical protein